MARQRESQVQQISPIQLSFSIPVASYRNNEAIKPILFIYLFSQKNSTEKMSLLNFE